MGGRNQNGQSTQVKKRPADEAMYQSTIKVEIGIKMDLRLACGEPRLELLEGTLRNLFPETNWGKGRKLAAERSTTTQSVFFPEKNESSRAIDLIQEKERSIDELAKLLEKRASQLFRPHQEKLAKKIQEQTKQQLPNVTAVEPAVYFSGSLLGNSLSVKR